MHPDVYATVGLHPHDAKNGVETITPFLQSARVVGIGECGLDYYYDHSDRAVQREAFAQQIQLAHELNLPLVIHTREAWDDTFDVLDAQGTRWMDGPLALAARHEGGPQGGRAVPAAPGHLEIVGQSEPLLRLLHELEVVAGSDLPVLLLGETGVGKELFARLLHRQSTRAARPLVHVNCAALPESLAESELFGHVRGAFSGAVADRPGRFEAAEGGTLFLDEVGELPLAVQAKLLRTLQNGEIQRLGADRPRRVNVRVIAATNRNLREQVTGGAFRADLYHRLSVYPVPIPPLRERGNDVLLLAGRFLELNRARLGLRSLRLSASAQDALRRYPWPGNIRELEHVVSRAALKALSRGVSRADIVTLEPALLDLDADAASVAHAPLDADAPAVATMPPTPTTADGPLRDAVDACQRLAITQALARHQGNWAQAARALEVDASNLHKLARRLGIK